MANLIQQPTIVMAAGNKRKEIAEYVGRLNSATHSLSIACRKTLPAPVQEGITLACQCVVIAEPSPLGSPCDA